jgi:hypothetical protein
MKETIHYISDFSYIKDRGHLREVLNYITRNLKLDNSLTTINKEKKEIWLQRAQYEKSKRKDSQLALRFHIALPNDQKDNPEFRKKVFRKLVEVFDIPDEHLDIAFHLDTQNNYHAHIIIYPRGKDGKKLRLKKNDLARIHREWDQFLQDEGYTIRKNNKVVKKPYFQYMREKTREMGYIPIPFTVLDQKLIDEGKKSFLKRLKKLEKKLNEENKEEAKKIRFVIKKIEEDKIKPFEEMIEKEAIKVAENQSIRKMMKNKEYLYKPLENPLEKSLDKIGNKDRNKDNQNLNLNDNPFDNWIDNWNNNRMKF